MKVFVAGTAPSSPAPSARSTSAAAASGLPGSFVTATVRAPPSPVALQGRHDLRGTPRLADRRSRASPRPAAGRRRGSGGSGRPSATGRPVAALEQVAAEDRGVVGRAARDDHGDAGGLQAGQRRGRPRRGGPPARAEPQAARPCPPPSSPRAAPAQLPSSRRLEELYLVAVAAVERGGVVGGNLVGRPGHRVEAKARGARRHLQQRRLVGLDRHRHHALARLAELDAEVPARGPRRAIRR